ncbi:MAP/microtubule affinity-regulating kinase 4 [Balamuthia mandrillaris]
MQGGGCPFASAFSDNNRPQPLSAAKELSVTSAIITINHDGIIQSVDKGTCQMFGYDLEELMGQKINKLIPTPYREQHDTYLANYHRTGRKRIIGTSRLVEAQHRDGAIFPIRLSVSEVKVGDSKIFIGMIDRVEDKAGTVTANHEGIIISCNKNCEAIWGYTVGEMVGQNLNMLMPTPHRERHHTYLENYHRTGIMKVIGRTRNVPAQHKNGTVFPVSLQVTKLQVGVVELFKGRVDKVDTSCEAVFTINKQGIIVSCNRNFVNPLFGYSDQELMGRHINVLIPSFYDTITSGNKERKGSKRKRRSSTDEALLTGTEGEKVEEEQGEEAEGSEEEEEKDDDYDDGDDEESENKEKGQQTATQQKQDEEKRRSWSLKGRRRLEVRHKDGSTFPVDFTISRFRNEKNQLLYSGRIRRVHENSGPFASGPSSGENSTSDVRASAYPQQRPAQQHHQTQQQQDDMSNSDSNCFIGEYFVEGIVGQGSYGKVKVATHRRTGQRVAIKILQKDLMDHAEMDRSIREIAILKRLDHPHIAKMYEVIETEDRIYIVMEYSEGGELLSYITKNGKLQEEEARRLFVQLFSAVRYCHESNIIHRDIKHKNILLDGKWEIKLIDFGLSNYTVVGTLRSTFCGTPAYAAPEMILAKKYIGPEVDVWSMGVVLFSMVAGRFPFGNVSNIISGQYHMPDNLSSAMKDLISRMLTVDTKRRATMQHISEHPWVTIGSQAPASTLSTYSQKFEASFQQKHSSSYSSSSASSPHAVSSRSPSPPPSSSSPTNSPSSSTSTTSRQRGEAMGSPPSSSSSPSDGETSGTVFPSSSSSSNNGSEDDNSRYHQQHYHRYQHNGYNNELQTAEEEESEEEAEEEEQRGSRTTRPHNRPHFSSSFQERTYPVRKKMRIAEQMRRKPNVAATAPREEHHRLPTQPQQQQQPQPQQCPYQPQQQHRYSGQQPQHHQYHHQQQYHQQCPHSSQQQRERMADTNSSGEEEADAGQMFTLEEEERLGRYPQSQSPRYQQQQQRQPLPTTTSIATDRPYDYPTRSRSQSHPASSSSAPSSNGQEAGEEQGFEGGSDKALVRDVACNVISTDNNSLYTTNE